MTKLIRRDELLKMMAEWKSGRFDSKGTPPTRERGIRLLNQGPDVSVGEPVLVRGRMFPDVSEDEAVDEFVNYGILLAGSKEAQVNYQDPVIATTLEPIRSGNVGTVQLEGVSVAFLTSVDSMHQYVDFGQSGFYSASSGPYRLVARAGRFAFISRFSRHDSDNFYGIILNSVQGTNNSWRVLNPTNGEIVTASGILHSRAKRGDVLMCSKDNDGEYYCANVAGKVWNSDIQTGTFVKSLDIETHHAETMKDLSILSANPWPRTPVEIGPFDDTPSFYSSDDGSIVDYPPGYKTCLGDTIPVLIDVRLERTVVSGRDTYTLYRTYAPSRMSFTWKPLSIPYHSFDKEMGETVIRLG